ncbi:hypothetical protein CI109_103364 [Kwoniella shandongensis]|uniref:Chitobiosyldiphosphodolichol beta-mannosyltransferase n=1 Tax=Kwoniella shandongensis TaxID=1734106 RepID=A0A5M6BWR4_9TREE|nr:uncharacterized protein CI109_004445 [Kwoniella shandongensis]KAA5527153.1 hypothetical protein CI109_004445 [Kwoniella shandongensis]
MDFSFRNPMFPDEPLYQPVGNPHLISPVYILSIFLLIVTPYTLLCVLLIRRSVTRPSRHRTATVLVLGDVGRSPRMMYHAESLSKHGWQTFLVGYDDTPPIPALLENPLVQVIGLSEGPKSLIAKLPWILRAPLRVALQIYSVVRICIWTIPFNTEILLVQNPPSIPTLALAQLVSAVTGARLIIDWHNTGYSILGMRLGKRSPLVKIARWFERFFGQNAFAHLFVTRALEEYLVREWSLYGRSAVLHDRPPPNFRRTETMIQHELFQRLVPILSPPLPDSTASSLPSTEDPNSTLFTTVPSSRLPVLRPDRPALVVSSTSWTADEDFSLLITALDHYQSQISTNANLPRLIVIITGLGSLRASFEKTVAEREQSRRWKDIFVRCVFLPAKDYPTLLGCADLGVSLHSSSSGRDLPMKVVDMFGCGVPVLARKFECIGELVKEGKNGMVFQDGKEMGEQLVDVLTSFPSSEKLNKLKAYFDPASPHVPRRRATILGENDEVDEWNSWEDNWDRVIYEGILKNIKRPS